MIHQGWIGIPCSKRIPLIIRGRNACEDLNDAFNYGVVVLKPDAVIHAGHEWQIGPESGTVFSNVFATRIHWGFCRNEPRRFGQAVDARLWRWLAPLQYSDLGLQNWLSVSHCSLIIPPINSPLFPNYFSVISQWCSYYSLMISQLCAHYFPIIAQIFPQLFPHYHFLLYIIIFSWFPPNASQTKLRVLSPRKSSEVGLCDQTLVAGYVAEKTSLHFFEVREGKGSDWRFLRGNSNWHPLKKLVSAVFCEPHFCWNKCSSDGLSMFQQATSNFE